VAYDRVGKMKIVGINKNHNSSVALFEDDNLIFFIENERLSNIKHHDFCFQAIDKLKEYTDSIDYLVISGLSETRSADTYKDHNVYVSQILGINKSFYKKGFKVLDNWNNHHKLHASNAFYNSGFKEALCIVKDGMGSEVLLGDSRTFLGPGYGMQDDLGRELGSAFIFSYPFNVQIIEKQIGTTTPLPTPKFNLNNGVSYLTGAVNEGAAYSAMSVSYGFEHLDAGKVMGMSSYGKIDTSLPDIYDKNNLINNQMFIWEHNNLQFPKMKYKVADNFESKANFAYKVQTEIQNHVTAYILNLLKITGQKNLCLSGGFFLNCVANYHLLKNLPDDVQIYIDPIASDAGTAIGAARLLYRELTNDVTINPQTNIYYGPKHDIKLSDLKNEKIIEKVTPEDVAKLLADKKIIALYQGRSEAGPRALGNRSILYDPRDPNGKDHVNTVKKREWFRPFAGTVLLEKARDWFDLRSLTESKFMMFAVDVWPDKQALIPAITHVDGTCRVQTLKREDNPSYYDLIQEFDKLTGVPILFNTSFNLAGNTIVETLKDALWTIHNSAIDYLYLPELKVLVTKVP
jgi:carbamoyltransferase